MKKNKVFNNTLLSNLLESTYTVFKKNPSKNFNYKQIAKFLKILSLAERKKIIHVLEVLLEKNLIEETKKGKFRLHIKKTLIRSFVSRVSFKGVFVLDNKNREIFIDNKKSMFSLQGDEVEVNLLKIKKNKYIGEITNVIKRVKHSFVGKLDCSSGNCFLITDDKKISFDIFIKMKKSPSLYLNKKLLVKVTDWSKNYKNPYGKIIKELGIVGEHDSEILSILHQHNFSQEFPDKVLTESKKISKYITKKDYKNRIDFRDTTTFTIDPKNAKDFDDAISVKNINSKVWEIGVHIADVSHYVENGSNIDKEALFRSTSIYLVDRVIPMLPESLSNDICSLKPNVDRLAFSVIFNINKHAEIISFKISETIIHSNKRFSYEEAQNIINKGSGTFYEELQFLNKISKILKEKRNSNGSINFMNNDIYFILDKKNNPISIEEKKMLETNNLIEEFMLLSNKYIASFVSKNQQFIYRVHDYPDREKIKNLKNVVKKFGYNLDVRNYKTLSNSLNFILLKTIGKSEQKLIEVLALRAMAKANYSTKNIGHYGLAFEKYCHFTSPIRRYTDLIVHRILKNIIFKKKFTSSLNFICKNSNEKEKKASTAERDSIKYMQIKYMKTKEGEKFKGIITGVTDWGLYVELEKIRCEGLIKLSELQDDHYIYNKTSHFLEGYNSGKKFKLGQKVNVLVKKADTENKILDFKLV